MRFGRNVARTFFEYYRFTNVLSIPMLTELKPRKGRPRTHRSRARSRVRYDVQVRPKTTRAYAPISYTDLAMHYDSSDSNEGSPVRYGFGTRSTGNKYMNPNASQLNDQYSLLTIHSSKFNNLEFARPKTGPIILPAAPTKLITDATTINIGPKPYLSIIDFNQLTRGGLEQATKKASYEKMAKSRANP